MSNDQLRVAQKSDSFCAMWLSFNNREYIPVSDEEAASMNRERAFFVVHDGLLKRIVTEETKAESMVPVLPREQVRTYLEAAHDRLAHQGRSRTLASLRHRVWWPGMKGDVEEFIRNCPTCCFNREIPTQGAMLTPDNGDRPWTFVQLDAVDLELTASGMKKAVIFACRMIRKILAFPATEHLDATEFLNIILNGFVARTGTWPRFLFTDRDSVFLSSLARSYYLAMHIEHVPGDAYMHTVVGICERFNHTLRAFARAIYFDQQCQWDAYLTVIECVYNSAIDPHTGYSPQYLDSGREAVLPWEASILGPRPSISSDERVQRQVTALHSAWEAVAATRLRDEEQRRTAHANKYRTDVSFDVGDRVLIKQDRRRSKMDMPYVGPYRVAEKLERDRYLLRDRRNVKLHNIFHVKRLKLYPRLSDGELAPDDDYYIVDHIVDRRYNENTHRLEYRLRYVGYTARDDTWEDSTSFTAGRLEEVAAYNQLHPLHNDDNDVRRPIQSRAGPARGRGAPRRRGRGSGRSQ